jgi:hypothetical protein
MTRSKNLKICIFIVLLGILTYVFLQLGYPGRLRHTRWFRPDRPYISREKWFNPQSTDYGRYSDKDSSLQNQFPHPSDVSQRVMRVTRVGKFIQAKDLT